MRPSLTSCLLTTLIPLGFKARVSSTDFDTSPPRWRTMWVWAICRPGYPACLAVHHSTGLEREPCFAEEWFPPASCRYTQGTGSTSRRMCDYGWLSCGQHQDSLIWLNLPVVMCAASEPCCILLPIRAQWGGVPARTPLHTPSPEHSAGSSGPACPFQSGLSSPVLLHVQEVCLGRAKLLQLKDHRPCSAENKSQILPIPHFPGRAWRVDSSDSSMQCLLVFFLPLPAVCTKKVCSRILKG